MAGPNTSVLSDAMIALKMKPVDGGAPGSGAAFEVTDGTIAMLTSARDAGKKVIVTDGGEIEVR